MKPIVRNAIRGYYASTGIPSNIGKQKETYERH